MVAHKAAELERHPVGVGELQIGNAVPDLIGQLSSLGEPRRELRGEAHEARFAPGRDLFRRVVGAEEACSSYS